MLTKAGEGLRRKYRLGSELHEKMCKRSFQHTNLLIGFRFVSWLLIMLSVTSVAILMDWYVELANRPKPTSIAIHVSGCVSLLANFLIIAISLDGLQRSMSSNSEAKFATNASLLVIGCLVGIEAFQLYLFHAVARPDQIHSHTKVMTFADWLHWLAVAFVGPIAKIFLICIYNKLTESQEKYVQSNQLESDD